MDYYYGMADDELVKENENSGNSPVIELTGRAKGLANLRPPFKIGHAPLPGGGHPKGVKNLTCRVKRLLRHRAPEEIKKKILEQYPELEEKDDLCMEDIIAYQITNAAMKEIEWAVKEIWDRTEGKAKQSMDLSTLGDKINTRPIVQVIDNEHAEMLSKLIEKEEQAQTELQ